MRARRLLVWALAAGCGGTELTWSAEDDVDRALPEEGYRGPAKWSSVAGTTDIALIRSDLTSEDHVIPDRDGVRILFAADGNACAVDVSDGFMDTDLPMDEDEIEVTDGGEDGSLVVLSASGTSLVSRGTSPIGGGSEVLDHVPGNFLTARSVGGDLVGVLVGGDLQWGWFFVDVPGASDEGFEAASDGEALFVATLTEVVRVTPEGSTVVVPSAVAHVAWDGVSGELITAVDQEVRSAGWDWSAPGAILELSASDDLGLVLVDVDVDGDRRVVVLDAVTGLEQGTLDLRDDSGDATLSRTGGLLLQERPGDLIGWRVTR